MGKEWEEHRKNLGRLWERSRKDVGKLWYTMGKPWYHKEGQPKTGKRLGQVWELCGTSGITNDM